MFELAYLKLVEKFLALFNFFVTSTLPREIYKLPPEGNLPRVGDRWPKGTLDKSRCWKFNQTHTTAYLGREDGPRDPQSLTTTPSPYWL